MNTLVWKEFRENVRWLPIGLVGVTLIAWMVTPSHLDAQKLVAEDLVRLSGILLPLFAFALGVVQSFRDLHPAAAAYLNHRSVTEREVFLSKTIAGFCIYIVGIGLPLFLLAMWLRMQGLQWLPVRPVQVIPSLVFGFAAFVMHPAAMLMMVRGVSWWGTRLFPLIPAGVVLIPLALTLGTGGLKGAGYAMVAASAVLAWLILVACQGWRDWAADPPPARLNNTLRPRWLLPSYLVVSTLIVVTALVGLGIAITDLLTRSRHHVLPSFNQVVVNSETDEPWLVTYKQERDEKTGSFETTVAGGDRIEHGKSVNPLDPLDAGSTFKGLASLAPLDTVGGSYGYHDGFFSTLQPWGQSRIFYAFDHRGYLLCYGRWPEQMWERTVAADGVYPAGQLVGQPFTGNPLASGQQVFSLLAEADYQTPLIDAHGVYLLEENATAIRKIVDQRIDAATMFEIESNRGPQLIVRSGSKLLVYRLVDTSGSDAWFEKPASGPFMGGSRSLVGHQLSAELVQSFDLPPQVLSLPRMTVGIVQDGLVVASLGSPGGVGNKRPLKVFRSSSDGAFEVIEYAVAPGTSSPPPDDRVQPQLLLAAWAPGMVVASGLIGAAWESAVGGNPGGLIEVIRNHPVHSVAFVGVFLLSLLVSLVLVTLAVQSRDLRRGQAVAWWLSVPLLGLAAPLAILAIYRRVHRETCPNCEKPRRVDQSKCAHCGGEREPPQREGIEVIDRPEVPQADRSTTMA